MSSSQKPSEALERFVKHTEERYAQPIEQIDWAVLGMAGVVDSLISWLEVEEAFNHHKARWHRAAAALSALNTIAIAIFFMTKG